MRQSTRVDLLAQSIDLALDMVSDVSVDQYQDPTPCSEFTVRDLVNHIGMMLLLTRDAGTRAAPDPSLLTADPMPFLAGHPESDWAGLVAEKADPAVSAWSVPAAWEGEASVGGPPMAATALGGILIAEFAIHAWDVAVATGQSVNIPASLATTAFDTYSREAPRMRGLGLLGDEAPQETNAPLFDRALGLTGRDPRWTRPTR
ncbi:TIGR03086 family metal-binding protein [Streptomyces sp. NBC_01764]|uniref:TIGR03086 family metal-binding protein n=1 Tax=Streptomyces sp. NBC_01764 TaxID=2975935 RepID=UPI002258AEB3|nr:TIGR03086 family metal-binding protein [Streptomyces sp. NBC_01764]MCX4403068.1 TIGR03086 family metal-binding protein [Streptomyces sp. NBC_01764]